ncbi:hypothetical protein F4780DRAFT_284813 [Xylariomycetidae sp. FL0641]|nr:hypothetical protein F4780DRAFT_284813 [Xylariomycetidae sp. FL0641]
MAGVLPAKTLTPGLEFSSHVYGNAADKADAEIVRAYEIIKAKLPVLKQLNALISVSVGGQPPIYVDARGDTPVAKLLEGTPDEPDAQLSIKANHIILFSEGHLEPRFGLFKDAFFHEAYMPKGKISVAIKFADLLTPNPPKPVIKYSPEAFPRLPKPTEDIAQVKRDIKEFGYGLVKNALTPDEVSILRKAVAEQAAGETKAGVAKNDGGPKQPNQRIWVLTNKGDEFLDLLNHPLIDEMVPWCLGDLAHVHSYFANIARPGNVPMQLHTDQVPIQPPIRDVAFGMNIMWFLTDVTKENGGTRIYPGSHKGHVAPEDIFDVDGTVAAEGPAGTALVFESRIWHATGPNQEETGERPAILMFFMRSFVRLQENNGLSLRKDVEPKLSDRHKRFMGFYTTGAQGGIDGEVREGIYVSRKDDCVGRLREPIPSET